MRCGACSSNASTIAGFATLTTWNSLSSRSGVASTRTSLTEQDVTIISAINFYCRLNEHQFGSSKYRRGDRDQDRFWESRPSTRETLRWYLHLLAFKWSIHAIVLNFPYWKLLFLSAIFKTAVAQKLWGGFSWNLQRLHRKMIVKAAESIFNSDKIYRSYRDLNFGITV